MSDLDETVLLPRHEDDDAPSVPEPGAARRARAQVDGSPSDARPDTTGTGTRPVTHSGAPPYRGHDNAPPQETAPAQERTPSREATRPSGTGQPAGTSVDDTTAVIQRVTDTDRKAPPARGTAVVADGFQGTQRALTQLAWLGAALLTAVVSIFRADRPSLWGDELATWGMTTVPWHSMWSLLRSTDMINGPYYYLMRGWTELLGRSDMALRLPSVIAMTVTAALVATLGSRLVNPRVGLLAGLLFAVVPATSRYAQEARGYALVVCFAALATLLLVRALDRPRFARWAPYALVMAAMGLLNVAALLLVVAHVLMVVMLRRTTFWAWLPCAVLGVAPGTALLYLALGQRGQVGWIPQADLRGLATLPDELFGAAAIGGCLLVLAALAVSYRHPSIVYTAWAVVPVVVLFIVGHYTSLWLPRYLLFTLPAWTLLAAMTLNRVPLVRGLLVVGAMALVSVPAQLSIRAPAGHDQDTRAVATIIAANEQPDDGIVYGTDDAGGGWVGRDLVAHYLAPGSRPKDLMAVQAQRTHGKVLAVECRDAAKCLNGASRIWVVRVGSMHDPLSALGGNKESVLRASFQVSHTWRPAGMTVALLTRRPE